MAQLENCYALLIGIGADLPITVRDARAVYNILADEAYAGYPAENIILITEEQATRKGILDALDELIAKTSEDSSVLLFYSGHGGLYEPWNQFYLVPHGFDEVEYETTWVKAEELREKISKIKSRRLVFFLDCCHAAGMTQSLNMSESAKPQKELGQAEGLAQHIDDGRGMSIVSSCREDQLSYIMDGDHNSLYTKCLQEVLKAEHKKQFEEPFIRISEVVQYIFRKVPERNPAQRPYANLQIYDDFILSCVPKDRQSAVLQESSEPDVVQAPKNEAQEMVTVFRETPGANNAILFVHGFSGESADSFGDIPNLLMQESSLEGWDMFPLGYSEYVKPEKGKEVWASVNDIERIADYMATSLKYKFDKYDRIAIIGYSLGGLVAQKAILDSSNDVLDRISHLVLFGSPNNGLSEKETEKIWNKKNSDLAANNSFIKNLRDKWSQKFDSTYPFDLKVVAATQDEFIPLESNFSHFPEENCYTVAGSHLNMVKVYDKENDAFHLIENSLNNTTFFNMFTSAEDINITLGEYEAVIKKLLPQKNDLDPRGVKQLVFALEGLSRHEEAVEILLNHDGSKDNSDLLGMLGGRLKRSYLENFSGKTAQDSAECYKKGLAIAEERSNKGQIYYHAINLAFLSLVAMEDIGEMEYYASKALEAAENDSRESLWKLATLGEANLYLNNLEKAKSFYEKASEMAGIREKISIHTNAYKAYVCLTQSTSEEDDFVKFLKAKFLS
ncbi:caspase family protein [Croceivirga thetidis]|uniref:Peptidase C14 caspase domain-containing protein n=1 Tax=Croceivirga thetidis TaxID=2721623 RepID=A0ABX1GQV2_9FLAO|nr:caspase family protein [Croceivirga thetidis]NKI32315.1 hypothetical protein [Croceivirga thetidis]